MTDDHGRRDTSSLSDVAHVRGQGDQGTKIVGGIAYPRVVVAGISIWQWQVSQWASAFAGDDE
jgi:hypothetical protein